MPHSFTARSRWKAVIPVSVFLAVLGAYLHHAQVQQGRLQRLKEIHSGAAELLRAHTTDAKAQRYPPMATGEKIFQPDLGFCPDLRTTYPNGAAIADYLEGKAGVEVCYLGYFAVHQGMGLAVLDAFERDGPAAVCGEDIHIREEDTPYLAGVSRIGVGEDWRLKEVVRLREGVERFLIHEVSDPTASDAARRRIPLLWEMPDKRDHGGGWVVFLDGHSEWYPYPGPFPMTKGMVARLRSMMPPSPDSAIVPLNGPSTPPIMDSKSPVIEIAEALVDPFATGHNGFAVRCDATPSMRAGEAKGYRIDADGAYVLFPVDDPPPAAYGSRDGMLYVGEGRGYHWYAPCGIAPPDQEMPPHDPCPGSRPSVMTLKACDDIRQCFGLRNGYNRLAMFQRALDAESRWGLASGQSVGLYLLARLEEDAVSFLKTTALGHASPSVRANAIVTLSRMQCDEAQKALHAVFERPDGFTAAMDLATWLDEPSFGQPIGMDDEVLWMAADALIRSADRGEAARLAAEMAAQAWKVDTKAIRRGTPERMGRRVLRALPAEIARPCIEAAIAKLTPEEQEKVRSFLLGTV